MDMRLLINLVETEINEAGAGASRLVKHMEDGTPFLMISAMRADLSSAENKKRTIALKNSLTKLPVTFIITGGEFHELGQEKPSEEISFFITPRNPNVTVDAIIKFGKQLMNIFAQDAIIVCDGETVTMIEKNGTSFPIGNAASFDQRVIKSAPGFSKIKNKKFTFTSNDDAPIATSMGANKKVG